MAPEGKAAADDGNELGFDERMAKLEALVSELEEGGLALEPAIARYQEGVELLKGCHEQLGRYRRQVEELSAQAEGALGAFADDPDVGGPPR